MKIKVVKTPAVMEEVEIKMPCFRKRYDDSYAYIHDKGHIVVNTSINSIYKTTGKGAEYFDHISKECTQEEFMEAFEKVESKIREIKTEITLPF